MQNLRTYFKNGKITPKKQSHLTNISEVAMKRGIAYHNAEFSLEIKLFNIYISHIYIPDNWQT